MAVTPRWLLPLWLWLALLLLVPVVLMALAALSAPPGRPQRSPAVLRS